jgi:uncharacterized OsmC-like protein
MSVVTFHADVVWSGESVRSVAEIRGKQVIIDEPQSLGGTDQGPNPVEILLASLGGCINVLVTGFAQLHGVELKASKVYVEGDLARDGFMEVLRGRIPENVRPGFQEIRYRIDIDSPSEPAKIQELIDHVEQVCPIKDTLGGVPVVPVKEVASQK